MIRLRYPIKCEIQAWIYIAWGIYVCGQILIAERSDDIEH